MGPDTTDHDTQIKRLIASRERAEAILGDPVRMTTLTYESNGAELMTGQEFRDRFNIPADK